jgi:hypothetical protein
MHQRPPPDPNTRRWWTLLRAFSVLNLAALLPLLAAPADSPTRRVQVACAAVYTAVCAFRSFFPRVDLERTVLVDAWPSSIALGRSAATVAELAFTVQLALAAAALGEAHGLAWAAPTAAAFVPLIVVAQACCWLGVLTLDHRWHAAEESLWAVMMAGIVAVSLAAWPTADAGTRGLIALSVAGSASAAWVMVGVDIPMYFRRWRAEVAADRRFLGVAEGFADALRTRRPTGAWTVWRPEVMWMTPYFTLCVLLSQALAWMSP